MLGAVESLLYVFIEKIVIFAGSDKFNERELETFIKKKERELILLHVHVVLIYYFYLGFNQLLRYNFIGMSSFPTGMTGHLYKKMSVARFHPPP